MSLGGYKFAGFKCVKPSGATDSQWALLIHKTRLKAFLAANALVGNTWVQDWNNGTIDLESGDGMIYSLTSDGLNYVSFFKHKNQQKYYMIASLFKWACTSESSLKLNYPGPYTVGIYYSISYSHTKIRFRSLFHTISYERFPEDCLIYGTFNYPEKALSLVPISSWCDGETSTYTSCDLSSNNCYFKSGTIYFGYALRDSNILTFTHTFLIQNSDFPLYVKTSLVGFDSLNLSSPNDSANAYGICFTVDGNNGEIGVSNWTSGTLTTKCETLDDSFLPYCKNSSANTYVTNLLYLSEPSKAIYNNNVTLYPYESVVLTTYGARTQAPFLNADGIASKGTFNIDLLSCNASQNYNNTFDLWAPVSNGNYLRVANKRSSDKPYTCYYVGWDASNPDLLSEGAWPEYTGI